MAPAPVDLRNTETITGQPTHGKPRLGFRWRWPVIVLAIVLLLGAGVMTWLLVSRQQTTSITGAAQLKQVEQAVSRHYLLPSNEVPALATVTDASKLTSQFLKGAKNGDKILIYQTNQIAILYRPSIDRVVAVGPVTIDTPSSSSTAGTAGQ